MSEREDNRGRQRAQRMYPAEQCVECLATSDDHPIDRHHVDGDTLNNSPENVRILCRRCHMVEDGRLERLRERMRTEIYKMGVELITKWKGKTCAVESCSRPAKYRGWCNAHYYRARNNGWNPGSTPVGPYRRSQ